MLIFEYEYIKFDRQEFLCIGVYAIFSKTYLKPSFFQIKLKQIHDRYNVGP